MSGFRASLYLLLVCFCVGCVSAQPAAERPALSKKEQKLFAEARRAYDQRDFASSATLLESILEKNQSVPDVFYLRALNHRRLGQYEAALATLRRGQAADTSPSPTLYVELGQLEAQLGNFAGSLAAYQKYQQAVGTDAKPARRARADELVRKAEIALDLASRPVPYTATPLPGELNTSENGEYFPSLSADGNSLIFTRRVKQENEDFYRSDRLEDGSWSVAQPLAGVNSAFNEGAQSITADGKYLVFTICERPENRGSCDLYYSQQVESGGWTPAKTIGASINTEADESQPAISADGKLLFFSSNRPGGRGGKDIYVAGRLPDGEWSSPSNLGEVINTPGNEQYPFWAADGTTLYFTSDTHPGLGGEDLFRTRLTRQNTWAEVTNLGYPINTAGDETNIFIGLDGATAYFSKKYIQAGSGLTDVDIYTFELPADLRPTPATYLEARVIDAVTKQPVDAVIALAPQAEDAPVSYLGPDADGRFLTVLPAGKDYFLTVEQPGYLFYGENFRLTGELLPEEPFRLTVELQPVEEAVAAGGTEADGSIAFKNVLFETGSATLLPVSGQELDRLVNVLLDQPSLRVEIAGHTDDVGDEQANQLLSEQRAAAVSEYLREHEVDSSRITTTGYGESRPVATNDTAEGRAQNRRTTFKLSGR